MIVVPVFGKFVDVAPAYLVLPIAFIARSFFSGQIRFIEDPRSVFSASISVSIVVASTVQVIAVTPHFIKNLPNDIRGAMVGVYLTFTNVGLTTFSLAGGIMYDSMGPSSPFVLVAIGDLVIGTFAIILGSCGYLRS